MTGRLDGSTVAMLALCAAMAAPAVFALLRAFEVSVSAAGRVAAGLTTFTLSSLCVLIGMLGVAPWEWSGTWGGLDLALQVATETGLWWWPIAGAAYLAHRRPPGSVREAGGLALALVATGWVGCANTPAAVAAGCLAFGVALALRNDGGRIRVVASALVLAWVVLELGADARAVGIDEPTLKSLGDVARPYGREVLLVLLGTGAAAGLVPADLAPHGHDPQPRSACVSLLALTLCGAALVRVIAPALALGMGEWAQVLAWPALMLALLASTRQWSGREHGGVVGGALALMVLAVGTLGPAGLAAASALPALLAMAMVAQHVLRPHPFARVAPQAALVVGGGAGLAAVYWSSSTFETPGLIATMALVALGMGVAGASSGDALPTGAPRRLGGVLVLLAFVVGAPGSLAHSTAQRSLEAEAIARTRCVRLDSRDIDGLALLRRTSSCTEADRTLRRRYDVVGHPRPGGGG